MLENKINVELTINGQKVKVGHKFLEDISMNIPDVKENSKIFTILAYSDNFEVRDNIARKDNLSLEAIDTLLNDASDNIIDRILSNRDVNKYITNEQIFSIIEKNNIKLLSTIAENIDEFHSCDKCEILNTLVKHKSSRVKAALFSYSVSDLLSIEKLKELSNDEDFDVATEAKKELKNKLEKNWSY